LEVAVTSNIACDRHVHTGPDLYAGDIWHPVDNAGDLPLDYSGANTQTQGITFISNFMLSGLWDITTD